MLGQLFVHTLNVLLSNFVADVGDQNPCSLYFLNILVDTTLGVFIIYLTLRVTTHVLTDVWGFSGFVSGQYSDRNKRGRGKASRPKLSYWLKQLGSYFFALFVMKLIVTILFVIFPFLFAFGRWLLGLFGEAKNVQVLFVMCIFPLAMNTLQVGVDARAREHLNPPDTDRTNYSAETPTVLAGRFFPSPRPKQVQVFFKRRFRLVHSRRFRSACLGCWSWVITARS